VQRARLTSVEAELNVEVIDGAPVITHWGAPTGLPSGEFSKPLTPSVTNSGFDAVQNPGILREGARGFLGRSALSGHRNGAAWSSHFAVTSFEKVDETLVISLSDAYAELKLSVTYTLDTFGVLTIAADLEN
jgi:alpha-galactosidase